jgi:hypothetical protein
MMKPKTPNQTDIEHTSGSATDMEWLDLRRLRAHALVSDRTLRSWIHSPVDPLPAVRVKGKIFVRRYVFDTWLEHHTIKSLADNEGDLS